MPVPSLKGKVIEVVAAGAPLFELWLQVLRQAPDDIAEGHELRLAARFALAVSATCLVLLLFRYLAVLEEAAGTTDAAALPPSRYTRLRQSLAEGGGAAEVYARLLTRLLAAVDRFFGDAGQSAPAWQRRLFFGLRAEAPLWTAPAYDRCLLLALAYPICVLYFGWAISNNVGIAEHALGFRSVPEAWLRGLAVLSTAAVVVSGVWFQRATGWRHRLIRSFVFAAAIYTAFNIAGAGASAFAIAVVVSVSGAGAGAVTAASAGAFAFIVTFAIAGAFVIAIAIAGAGTVAGAGVIAFAAEVASGIARDRRQQPGFLLLFTVLVLILCLWLPAPISHLDTSATLRPFLLFFGLLTVLNAPFDWLSLGLTRGLLRRGLELQGPYPWLLALLDAALASALIVALAATMVLGVQAFDAMAVRGGGDPVLPLQPLFEGLATRPTDPEFWWLHALLLSTLLPSVVNLAVGGCSLLRGWPPLNAWLLRQMPEQPGAAAGLPANRFAVAGVLTAQWAVGAALGIAAQCALVWLILGRLLPAMGASLLDLMAALAQWNLPGRLLLGG